MIRRVTASKLQLAEHCTYPFHPRAEWGDVGPESARRVGLAFHAAACARVNHGAGVDVLGIAARFALTEDEQVEYLALWHAWDEHYTPRMGWRAEVSFAYSPAIDNARELGVELDRDYSTATTAEIPGSADLVTLDGDMVVVYDWKTGRQASTQPPEENRQLRFLGMCAAIAYRCTRARIVLAHITPDGVYETAAELDAWALEEIIPAEVRATVEDIARDADPSPGAHCAELWCPAVAACPSTARACLELVPAPEEKRRLFVVADRAAIQGAEHAAYLWHRLKAIDAAAAAAWKALDAWVDDHGAVPLPDGREYRRVEETRESIVADGPARAVLTEKLGARASDALKTSVSKERLREITRAVAGKGKPGAELERQTLAALRAEGSVRTKTVTTHEAAKPTNKEGA